MKASLVAAALCLLVSACGSNAEDGVLHGYAEADYLYLAPRAPGYVETLSVAEGDHVEAGAPVFRMDSVRAAAALEKARAGAAASSGETGASAQAIAAARANAELARASLTRTRELYRRDYASKAMLDQAQSAYDAARAAVLQAESQTRAARDLTQGARADIAVARADMEERTVRAPAAGRVELIFRRPGEFAPAGQPVIALLPPQNVKLRFFAPERLLAKLHVGQEVRVTCDGCAGPIEARISFIATNPQFTPPVIYSLKERDKLVFMIEARPVAPKQDKPLRPGQPVDIGLIS